jgi:hypothetical protein
MLSNKNKQHMAYRGGGGVYWTVDKQVLESVFIALLICVFFACRTSMKKSLEEKYPWLEQDIYTSYQSKVTFHFKLCQRDLL